MSIGIVYLMRGLPGSGKSRMAHRIGGVVIEPDQFFFQDGVYRYSEALLPAAREWAFDLLVAFMDLRKPTIVLDRGNNADEITHRFALTAIERGYKVELVEPDNLLWMVARTVLRDWPVPHMRKTVAKALSERTMAVHRVPVSVILARMEGWRVDLTVEDILQVQSRVS